jgi:hypothetical protein
MREEHTKKKLLIVFSVLIVVLIIGALVATVSPPSPIERDWMGICVHALSVNDARLVNESGSSWIRVDVSPDFEEAVVNAKAYNLKVIGILDSWMFNQNTTFTLEEWRGNVTHYVSRYADYVDAWEIWNEPANPKYPLLDLNVSTQENMSKIVEYYLSMVQIASPIIRQYDPSAEIVLFGGLNLWSGDDVHLALDKEFARQLAAMNITQYGDAISLHAYTWSKVNSTVWQRYDETLAYYRELFPLEIWATETGYPIEYEDESGPAQYMREALPYFRGKVTRLFWYSLLDNAGDQGKSFGLVGNGTLRLAYYELQKQLTGKSD